MARPGSRPVQVRYCTEHARRGPSRRAARGGCIGRRGSRCGWGGIPTKPRPGTVQACTSDMTSWVLRSGPGRQFGRLPDGSP